MSEFFVDGKFQKTWIMLTKEEKKQLRTARIKSWFTFKAPADYMSAELENIVCGGTPERYIYLYDWEEPETVITLFEKLLSESSRRKRIKVRVRGDIQYVWWKLIGITRKGENR